MGSWGKTKYQIHIFKSRKALLIEAIQYRDSRSKLILRRHVKSRSISWGGGGGGGTCEGACGLLLRLSNSYLAVVLFKLPDHSCQYENNESSFLIAILSTNNKITLRIFVFVGSQRRLELELCSLTSETRKNGNETRTLSELGWMMTDDTRKHISYPLRNTLFGIPSPPTFGHVVAFCYEDGYMD